MGNCAWLGGGFPMVGTNAEQWGRFSEEAKRAFARGEDMVAKRYFQLAEQEAINISPMDVTRGVSLSWLALLYFKAANYQLADEMFLEAEHIYTASEPSSLKTEILENFVKLGMYAAAKNLPTRAREYCPQDGGKGGTPAAFFRTSNMRLCQAKNWALAQRKTLAKRLAVQRNEDISNLRQRSAEECPTPVWSRFMDKLQRIASQAEAPAEPQDSGASPGRRD